MLVRFVNRSAAEFHQTILGALQKHGPMPTIVLSYRAEINEKQLQQIMKYLEEKELVKKIPITLENKIKIPRKYSLSVRNLISITEKGKKYLEMLQKLHSFIDWTAVIESNKKRNQQERWGK